MAKQNGKPTKKVTKPASSAKPDSAPPKASAEKRRYLSQSDVPSVSLTQAMRVARAIADEYAGDATAPLQVASALEMQPNSGGFRTLCGAALAYGLTDAGPNSAIIGLTPLGKRATSPLSEGDDAKAMREAFLKPKVVGDFLRKYDKSKFPRDDIARNVLKEFGVPLDKVDSVLALIKDSTSALGLFREIKNVQYVDLSAVSMVDPSNEEDEVAIEDDRSEESKVPNFQAGSIGSAKPIAPSLQVPNSDDAQRLKRVFVTHGKNRSFIDPLKDLLAFGEFEPVLSVDRETVSKPVPDKVMDDMRSCAAAIIHVEDEKELIDAEGDRHIVLNPNVLIEIGAAMALYGRRFILLVRNGVKLPSNLQGLYEVRYDGQKLDAEGTIKVLKALKDIKNHPLP